MISKVENEGKVDGVAALKYVRFNLKSPSSGVWTKGDKEGGEKTLSQAKAEVKCRQ
jgi:hypothetical protein